MYVQFSLHFSASRERKYIYWNSEEKKHWSEQSEGRRGPFSLPWAHETYSLTRYGPVVHLSSCFYFHLNQSFHLEFSHIYFFKDFSFVLYIRKLGSISFFGGFVGYSRNLQLGNLQLKRTLFYSGIRKARSEPHCTETHFSSSIFLSFFLFCNCVPSCRALLFSMGSVADLAEFLNFLLTSSLLERVFVFHFRFIWG